MNEAVVAGLRQRIRGLLAPLKATPLHPQWLVWNFHRSRTTWVAQRAVGDVLDVGCADSAIRNALGHCNQYIGLDYPTTAISLYKTRPDVLGDAASLPISSAMFDTVMFLDVVEHLLRPEEALTEARRVLRPGGRLLVTVPFAYPMHDQPHDYQRFTEHGLRHRLACAGFGNIVVREVGDAVATSASNLAIATAQAGLEAIASRSWRMIGFLFVPPLVLGVNLLGWLGGKVLPVTRLMPAGYYIEAVRR